MLNLFNFRDLWFFNLFCKELSREEIQLIKNTGLFEMEDKALLKEICQSIKRIDFPEGKLLFQETEQEDAIYVVQKGLLQVFSNVSSGQKISITKLSRGDYFGKDFLQIPTYRNLNVQIETLRPVSLIRIDKKFLKSPVKYNTSNKSVISRAYNQLTKHLASINGFYGYIDSITNQINSRFVINYKKGDIIFKFGDKYDYVYCVLEGEVKILIPNPVKKEELEISVSKGHIFGELGVVRNKPRAGTALAESDLSLVAIMADTFNIYLKKYPEVREMILNFQKSYQLPIGTVEMYLGSTENTGPSITSIYKLKDSRIIAAIRHLNEDIFLMGVMKVGNGKSYVYEKDGCRMEISVFEKALVGIKSCGKYEHLIDLCRLLIEKIVVDESMLCHFELTGQLTMPPNHQEIICPCIAMKKSCLLKFIEQGLNCYEALSKATGVGEICGGCEPYISKIEKAYSTNIPDSCGALRHSS